MHELCSVRDPEENKESVRRSLTGGLVPVGAERDVVFLVPLLRACHFLHGADLRHAEFGVVVQEGAAVQDGQVVAGPVPQLTQVLVVQSVERKVPETHTHTRPGRQVGTR